MALPADVTVASLGLETEPAAQLAWTLQNYGMYVVDDTYWEVWALGIEEGPSRSFSQQFQGDWGFGFEDEALDSPWTRDMGRLFSVLAVVDNNGPASVGGGGKPRVPGIHRSQQAAAAAWVRATDPNRRARATTHGSASTSR